MICNIPVLYYYLRGLNIIIPLFALWIILGYNKIGNAFIFAFKNRRSIIVPYLLFLLLVILYFFASYGGSSSINIMTSTIQFFVIFVIFMTISRDPNNFIIVLLFFLGIQIIMASIILPVLINNPFIARATEQFYHGYMYDITAKEINLLGSGGYARFASYATTIPILLTCITSIKMTKDLYLISFISFFVIFSCVLYSSFAGSFALMILYMIIYAGLYSVVNFKIKKIIKIAGFALCTFILFTVVFKEVYIVEWAVDKIKALIDSNINPELSGYDVGGRETTAQISITAFEENIFFGIGLYHGEFDFIGDHNFWYDILGMFGLFGFTLVFLYWISIIYYLILFQKQNHYNFILGLLTIMIGLSISGFFNPILFFPEIDNYVAIIAGFVVGAPIKFSYPCHK